MKRATTNPHRTGRRRTAYASSAIIRPARKETAPDVKTARAARVRSARAGKAVSARVGMRGRVAKVVEFVVSVVAEGAAHAAMMTKCVLRA